jgi:hypothetical protein
MDKPTDTEIFGMVIARYVVSGAEKVAVLKNYVLCCRFYEIKRMLFIQAVQRGMAFLVSPSDLQRDHRASPRRQPEH